jgi:hypothetical protein
MHFCSAPITDLDRFRTFAGDKKMCHECIANGKYWCDTTGRCSQPSSQTSAADCPPPPHSFFQHLVHALPKTIFGMPIGKHKPEVSTPSNSALITDASMCPQYGYTPQQSSVLVLWSGFFVNDPQSQVRKTAFISILPPN